MVPASDEESSDPVSVEKGERDTWTDGDSLSGFIVDDDASIEFVTSSDVGDGDSHE